MTKPDAEQHPLAKAAGAFNRERDRPRQAGLIEIRFLAESDLFLYLDKVPERFRRKGCGECQWDGGWLRSPRSEGMGKLVGGLRTGPATRGLRLMAEHVQRYDTRNVGS